MSHTNPVPLGAALRSDFPVFQLPAASGEALSYLDSASTSQKPQVMIDTLADSYAHHYANVHRGIYKLSADADARYENARRILAGFIGARAEEVVFTRNATEALNLVAYSWGRANLTAGDLVVATEMEHHANLVPWQQLALATGASLGIVTLTDDGYLDMDSLHKLLVQEPKLVAISHVSNSLGTINPVLDITRASHAAGAMVVLDVAQSVPHMPVDVGRLEVDFAALSGHKMLGPSGIGALWARKALLDAMPPFLTGGNMISRVTSTSASWNESPAKFEAGTPAIAEAMGLAVAIAYLQNLDTSRIRDHERELFVQAWDALGQIRGIRRLGPASADDHAAVISFDVAGIHPHDLATLLDSENIAVRAGHHCAQPVMQRYGLVATTRASFYVYNDLDDIERLVTAIENAQRRFGV